MLFCFLPLQQATSNSTQNLIFISAKIHSTFQVTHEALSTCNHVGHCRLSSHVSPCKRCRSCPSTKDEGFLVSQHTTISIDSFYLQVADPSGAQLKRKSIDENYGEEGFYGDVVQTPDVKRDDDVFDEGVNIKVPRADDQA